jgi:hypothetical protein
MVNLSPADAGRQFNSRYSSAYPSVLFFEAATEKAHMSSATLCLPRIIALNSS